MAELQALSNQILAEDVGGFELLIGEVAPGGETVTDAAAQNSCFLRTTGQVYFKDTAGVGTDKWTELTTNQIFEWNLNLLGTRL